MEELKWNEAGLLPAIAQDRLTGQVRMVAWMNREALAATLRTGRATFFSRSRQKLWEKGETSGNALGVHAIVTDCDADTLLLLIDPAGPSCHTGRPSCFFREVRADGSTADLERDAAPFLDELEAVIQARQQSTGEKSYTRALLDGGAAKVGAKLTEEAAELARAIADESDERVQSEAADLLYHLLVGLRLRGVSFRDTVAVLAKRAGISGHAEKASRTARDG